MKDVLLSKFTNALASMSGINALKYEEDPFDCVDKLQEYSPVVQESRLKLTQYDVLEFDLPVLPVFVSGYSFKKYRKRLMEYVGYDMVCVDENERGKESIYLVSLFKEDERSDLLEQASTLFSCSPNGHPNSVFICCPDPEVLATVFKLKQLWE